MKGECKYRRFGFEFWGILVLGGKGEKKELVKEIEKERIL